MPSMIEGKTVSKRMLWSGRIIGTLPVLLILFASVIKLMHSPAVVEGFRKAGFSEHLILVVGVVELICSIVYLIPATRVLGAILLTGLMGGATATNVRVGDPSYIVTIVFGILIWAGLFMRDIRVREFLLRL